jgi:hypothetical protein
MKSVRQRTASRSHLLVPRVVWFHHGLATCEFVVDSVICELLWMHPATHLTGEMRLQFMLTSDKSNQTAVKCVYIRTIKLRFFAGQQRNEFPFLVIISYDLSNERHFVR